MTRKFIVRTEAQSDIDEGALWYEKKATGVGLSFLEELEVLLSRITAMPEQFPEIEPTVRRGLMRRFPYSIYFKIESKEIILLAVLHMSRQPDIWKGRLR